MYEPYGQRDLKLKKNMPTAAALFYIKEAFDIIWHSGFLYKLHKFNISTNLIDLISSFFQGENSQFLSKAKYPRLEKYKHGRLKVPFCPQYFTVYIYIYNIPKHQLYIWPSLSMALVCMPRMAKSVMFSESCSAVSIQVRRGASAGTLKSMKIISYRLLVS
jgi:hypothetical protein